MGKYWGRNRMNETKKFEITHYPWDINGYKPKTFAEITRDDKGFAVHFTSYETEISAVQTEHNTDIYCDSAVELFIKFSPETDKHYINFEINPNAAMYCSYGTERRHGKVMEPSVIDTLDLSAHIFPDRWEANYYISVDFIKKFFPDYTHGGLIMGNLYKTGEKTKYPHWGCWRETGTEKPDFHRPESFDIMFEKR